MKNTLYVLKYRVVGILGCLLDLGIQMCLTAGDIFRKDPDYDDTEKFYHE